MQRLSEGYRQRDIRVMLQRHLRSELESNEDSLQNIVHRDQAIHGNDIYNIYRKAQEAAYKKHMYAAG
ncbi:hypothetical protein DFQ30_002081 [Apophysomyces sp. BC1015]|nr:hypothetical protein DFQ30_002081 [Apophysomyces sp. BC1015]KAG0166382.1 hypothetical protein DFQ29_000999 [Apophysomyces sp. BC1021]